MVTELLSKGNACNLLKTEKVAFTELVAIARGVVAGLQFLHSAKIVHADLALRNVLIASSNDTEMKYMAKVSDFGLSKTLYGNYYKSQQKENIPIRWCALEVIQFGQYSVKSDVWSLGVLFW